MLKSVSEANTEWFVATSAKGSTNHGDAVRVPYHAASMTLAAKIKYTVSRPSVEVVVSAMQGGFVDPGHLIY